MAIYHCHIDAIKRSEGRSSVAAAAYRSGEKIEDEHTGEMYDYRRKRGVLEKYIVVPDGENIPERKDLWNMAENVEKRKDARPARQCEIALPDEFDQKLKRKVCDEFAQYLVDTYHVAVDVCIHAPGRGGDFRNYHAHILFTTREFEDGKLTNKTRVLDGKITGPQEVTKIRHKWADICNQYLDQKNQISAEQIEHPTIHIGKAASAMERRGIKSDLGNINRKKLAERAEKKSVKQNDKVETDTVKIQTPKMEEDDEELSPLSLAYRDLTKAQRIGLEIDDIDRQIQNIKDDQSQQWAEVRRARTRIRDARESYDSDKRDYENSLTKLKEIESQWFSGLFHKREIEDQTEIIRQAQERMSRSARKFEEAKKTVKELEDKATLQDSSRKEQIEVLEAQKKPLEEERDSLLSKPNVAELIAERERRKEDIKRQMEAEQQAREQPQERHRWHR